MGSGPPLPSDWNLPAFLMLAGLAQQRAPRRGPMIGKQLLLSSAAICLILASGPGHAQSPADSKKEDAQKERVQRNEPAKGAEPRSDTKGQEKSSEQTREQTRKTPPSASTENG